MAPTTLGERLAQSIRLEQENTREAAERAAREASDNAMHEYRTVARFFESAQKAFMQGIEAGKPTKSLEIVVGTRGLGDAKNTEVYGILKMFESADKPRITQPNHPFHSLWCEFLEWARTNGLEPTWDYRWDGGGVHSWWVLGVKPLTPAAAAQPWTNPNDVTKQHTYCLHVLGSVVYAYLDASRALEALNREPQAQEHLARFSALRVKCQALSAQLGL